MFRWHKDVERLNIPAQQVLRLQRSHNEVPVALPGLAAQKATAYLCLFSAGKGVRCAVALHLHSTRRVAFYFHEKGEARKQDLERLAEEGAQFAESMGFILGDLDLQLRDAKSRAAIWESLPLAVGKTSAPKVVAPDRGSAPAAEDPPPAVAVRDNASGTAEISPASSPPPAAKHVRQAVSALEPIVATRYGAAIVPEDHADPEHQRLKFLRSLGRLLASL